MSHLYFQVSSVSGDGPGDKLEFCGVSLSWPVRFETTDTERFVLVCALFCDQEGKEL